MQSIVSLNNNKELLRNLSHHAVENAFHSLDFGEDPNDEDCQGIHGGSPPEMLHLYQQGLYKYAMDGFISQLTVEQKRNLDQLIGRLSFFCSRQCDRSFPRFRFPRGISNLSRFTASEQVGLALISFLCVRMHDFERVPLMYNRGNKTYSLDKELFENCTKFSKLFERMLIVEAWINQDNHSLVEVRDVAPLKITKLMESFKSTLQRTTGNGLKIPKFHQLKHLPRYIQKYGSPNNFSTSRCESHHIDLSKKPAKTAQKRDETFEQQVGHRIIDSIVIRRATQSLQEQHNNIPNRGDDYQQQKLRNQGTRFSIVRLELGGNYVAIPVSGPHSELPFDQKLLNKFGEAFGRYFPPLDGIPCFTEQHRRDGDGGNWHIFRGHPQYKGKPWHDWVYVQWTNKQATDEDSRSNDGDDSDASSGNEDVPGKILFFVDLTSVTNHPDYKPDKYVVVESFLTYPKKVKGSSIIYKGQVNPHALFELAWVDSIVDVAFVIPNLGMPDNYYVVLPPCEWRTLFNELV
jgi:hypothetical protein